MRCYICDFSDTGENDPITIEVDGVDTPNRVVYDITVGKDICLHCQSTVKETLDEYQEEEINE